MEFWAVEIKPGAPVQVKADSKQVIHISQATLGEVKKEKGNESINLFLDVDSQKLVIGTLSPEKIPQISYDLMLDRNFELSQNGKNRSIYLLGYRASILDQTDDDDDTDFEFGDDLPVITKENGKPEPKEEKSILTTEKANAAKPKVKIVEPKKDDDEDSDEDSDEDDDSEESESEEGPLDIPGEDSSDEDDEDSDEEDKSSDEDDENTPKKAEVGKKRPVESATKTPVPEKKAKLVTPQKTGPDGKKGAVHVATPHPSKKSGKTPANNDKSKQQTPKSAGQVVCKSCSKTFNSDNALQSHSKAKHADGK